jgi:protein arginine N-methyltransferase 1
MLADLPRVRAMGGALRAALRPGDAVLDIGTGSGLLAMLACRYGAGRVYAVERGHILEVARQVARHNGLDGRIEFFAGHSTKVELPEKVDLVVAELIGDFGLDEGIWPVFADARRRFLKPEGRLLPEGLALYLAPTAEGGKYLDWLGPLQEATGLDFSPLRELSSQVSRNLWAEAASLLGPAGCMLRCDLYQDGPAVPEGEVRVEIRQEGLLAGWVGWFEAFAEGRPFLSTAPPNAGSSWSNVFFPIGEAVPVRPGDQVSLAVRLDRRFWSWEFRQNRLGLVRRLSDFNSYPPGVFKPKPRKR